MILKDQIFLDNLNNLIKIKGTPASIPHEYALYLLSKEMKKISVVLSGEGADEFFLGATQEFKNLLLIFIKIIFLTYLKIFQIKEIF